MTKMKVKIDGYVNKILLLFACLLCYSLEKDFVDSQFGNCPLVWMSHSRSFNKTLRIPYNDKLSSF